MKWIGPGTEETLEQLGREGVTDVLVVPLSFVSDHIETLYEVDMLFADAAREAGIAHYRRTESLNTSPLFIARAGRTRRGPSRAARAGGVPRMRILRRRDTETRSRGSAA